MKTALRMDADVPVDKAVERIGQLYQLARSPIPRFIFNLA